MAQFSENKVTEHESMFWFSVQLLPETSLTPTVQCSITINVRTSSHEVPGIAIIFKHNLNFFNNFLKNTQISNLMKIYPVGTEFFHADRQT
jgi:hypothetical protein